MKNRLYYTLVASLPHLPRFDKAERLPINTERLIQRLKMLEPDDLKLADKAVEFIAWRSQPVGRTNAEIVAIYEKGVNDIYESPLLKPLFEFPVDQRTIMAALRRRERGLPRPAIGEPWGAGHLVKTIEKNWDHPYFKLNAVYPWIVEARHLLLNDEPLKLEYLLLNLRWNKINLLTFKNYFGFDAVIAYLLKWDILHQWLAYNRESANIRFEELVTETINEYNQPLNFA